MYLCSANSVLPIKKTNTMYMKTKVQRTLFITTLMAFLMMPCVQQSALAGNDYLQKFDNYSVMSMGNGVLRFTIPVWVYGEGSDNTYYLNPHTANNSDINDSYLWYSETAGATRGSSSVHRIVSFGGTRESNYDGRTAGGVGYAYALVDAGSCIITNTYNGEPLTLTAGDRSHWIKGDHDASSISNRISVTRMNSSYGKYHVYLQIDWYIPEELQTKDFYIGLNVRDYYVKNNNLHNAYWWQWGTKFYGGDTPQSPQLFEPYFYSVAAEGVGSLGMAAVQYMTYQDPISYHTSLNPTHEVPATERNCSIVVAMEDTVQDHFYADFNVWTNKEAAQSQRLQSNKVMIPAYHKIYDFAVSEVLNAQNGATGDVNIEWQTRRPEAQDIMESDVFEVQRATTSDFSDARSIGVLPLMADSAKYQLTDEARNVLQLLKSDTIARDEQLHMSMTERNIELGEEGGFNARIDATMSSDFVVPGVPLYYRVRRASAATWGWYESPYMAQSYLVKTNYLAPLAQEQVPYSLDPDFDKNRLVHFYFRLDNSEIHTHIPTIDETSLKYTVDLSSVSGINVPVKIVHSPKLPDEVTFKAYQTYKGVETLIPYTIDGKTMTLNVPIGAKITIKASAPGTTRQISFDVPARGKTVNAEIHYTAVVNVLVYSISSEEDNLISEEELCALMAPHWDEAALKAEMYPKWVEKVKPIIPDGRCVWDRNADLILERKLIDTGITYEVRVPKDSIVLQADGSYLVHMTDVANYSCTHYAYSVRIDQTNALLQVQNPSQLEPIALIGPDLYTSSSADIASFEATDGTDKRGVILTWQPTAGSIDYYTLERRIEGSGASFDTLTMTDVEGYFDEHGKGHVVTPGTAYEYRLSTHYTCNGVTTVHTATTIGSRSPYGAISGRVQYEDGSGCYGVTVTLSQEGEEDIKLQTDETGAFLFDSLLYGISKTYTITPTSQTAQFVYEHTSSPIATITLTADNNVAENLTFNNISSVRFTGRVLYKLSSVPVRDANMLLNGKIVKKSGEPVKTDVSGNFSISVPLNSAFTLQIIKEGHGFEGDGFVRIDGDSLLTLSKALDGVRVWDTTKVRLTGRIIGGLDQAALPLGQGLSRNNLGDHIQLVLELEGDNISYIVRDPEDLTRDTLEYQVGETKVHYQHKRIIIEPDPLTGEYEADLFPTRYKVIQASAQGYATLFAQGKTSETIDLSKAEPDSFSITYRSPIEVTYKQTLYGMDYDYYGIKTWKAQALNGENVEVAVAEQDSTGEWHYLFGAPVFNAGRYQFRVSAHEDYYYNNDRSRKPDVVYLKGGELKIYNGMRETTDVSTVPLDSKGSALVNVVFDHVTFVQSGEDALHALDFSVESEGEYVNSVPLRAYVLGAVEKENDILEMDTTETGITLLDILRDPPGSQSYAYLEKGTNYHVSYKELYNYRFGAYLHFTYGNDARYFVGTYAGTPAAGVSTGILNSIGELSNWDLPIAVQWHGSSEASYTFTTNERIETGTDPLHVGSAGDVLIGVTNGVMTSKADAFRIVDSVSYEMLKGQIDNKNVRVVQQGISADGKPWYLMRTEDVLLKHAITSSFAYSQFHILSSVIPELLYRRNSLLLTGSRDEAVAAAQATNQPVYWSMVPTDSLSFGEEGSYEIITPQGYSAVVFDQVHLCNKSVDNWIGVIATNEAEKVKTQGDQPIQTISINGGLTQSYTESYAYSNFRSAYFAMPWDNQDGWGINSTSGHWGIGTMGFSTRVVGHIFRGVNYQMLVKHLRYAYTATAQGVNPGKYVSTMVGGMKFDFNFDPIMEIGYNLLPEPTETIGSSKTTGYVIAPDLTEHLTLAVYKSRTDDFNKEASETRIEAHNIDEDNQDLHLYGSLMYRTLGGATRCPWEDADSTIFYRAGTQLDYGTQRIENPQIVINRHEISNVPHDQTAKFTITMWNEIDEQSGLASGWQIPFTLRINDTIPTNGATILIDGMPLTDGRQFRFTGSTPIVKVLEVRAGDGYDYENINLILESECMPWVTFQQLRLSVHFMPVSCPVNISLPSDKWVMNTLSPQDERGYYMPINIDGFDVNYDNFDHIELQYKLASQSNDAWVNLCSYYAEDSLYQRASGTKEMITNGRIENYRFYGERDPMEQQYNLRAVSFCRHGSGFITRSSAVLTGVKDTRNPRVFGEPEPANAILGVGDNLKLRFNEAIAGNYLDEDNNFQVVGLTNESGMTTDVSLHFDGTENSYAETKVLRSLADKSFTIDMLIRPSEPNKGGILFTYKSEDNKSFFNLMLSNNRLAVLSSVGSQFSLPIPEPMTAFTRVIAAYDYDQHKMRFYVGTEDITNPNSPTFFPNMPLVKSSAPVLLGKGFDGNIMEVRLWSKALNQEEIALTHMHRLTGYEKELLVYYPMDEGTGNTVADKATGATLYTYGAAWEHQQGISLHLKANQQARLDGNILSRSANQDETIMFWFKTAEKNSSIFSAGRADSKHGTEIAFVYGGMYLRNDSSSWPIAGNYTDNEWHHLAIAIDRTHNNAAVYVDDVLRQTINASKLSAVSGAMFLGGKGFEGNIDQFLIFEQALPKTMLESFGTMAPVGDEMGLIAFLPFSEMKENSSGIYEQIFSVNNQRQFKNSSGELVYKVQPLVLGLEDGEDIHTAADKQQCAPVHEMGKLTKLNFDWAFNNDELLINLNMLDREINKQTVYITVRDVEDVNGNPMISPVTWTAFVDKNALKWEERTIRMHAIYGDETNEVYYVTRILNNSGKRHQFNIESLPDWLTVDKRYGAIEPTEELYLTLMANTNKAPGVYEDIVYLTDENGLSEPMRIEFTIEALPLYDEVDRTKYPLNMSLCGRVVVRDEIDTDVHDIVYALYRNECIGMANISFDYISSTSSLFLTIYGNETMNRKDVSFVLWQASTGKVITLAPSERITFASGAVYGCGADEPIILTANGSEIQQIPLNSGWNWVSYNLDLRPSTASISKVVTAIEPWTEGDIIKNPASRHFVTYSDSLGTFVGDFSYLRYIYTYMVYCSQPNTMCISGDLLPADSMYITVRGNGQWSALPCLLNTTTPLIDAMADYYDYATPGDLIKSHDHFATFSMNRKWEGDLSVLRPGEGYFIRRVADGDVTVRFFNKPASAPKYQISNLQSPIGQRPQSASTNMTMICALNSEAINAEGNKHGEAIYAYIGDELVGKATKIDDLYFLTISYDQSGSIRFETEDGTPLTPFINRPSAASLSSGAAAQSINYKPDAHYGSLTEPVLLVPDDANRVYKIIENDHVVIIRNNEKYDVTGTKLK